MANKVAPGPPPQYPDAVYAQQNSGSPAPYQQGANAGYYGQPQYGQPPPQGYYGYGPPPGMQYQGQPQQGAPGYFADGRERDRGSSGGLCAAVLAAIACCCCLDCIF